MNTTPSPLEGYLTSCRRETIAEIRRIVPEDDRHSGGLYELMLEYPLRPAKGLRPALCIATARALGSPLAAVQPSAAALELYHNAFLIHDDVEDLSEQRRAAQTLHREHGVPIAVNVGDGMLAICLRPLLDNIEHVGLGPSLRILEVVQRMCRESAEGQMMELRWVREPNPVPRQTDIVRMIYKKTSWYSFIAPVVIGGICGGASGETLDELARFAGLLGIAFQIQDDVLNLSTTDQSYGKESCGDLWEGKLTLPLLYAVECASRRERAKAIEILGKPRASTDAPEDLLQEVEHLRAAGELSAQGYDRLLASLGESGETPTKNAEDVQFLQDLILKYGGVEFGWRRAERYSTRAANVLSRATSQFGESNHRKFLIDVCNYVVRRTR